MRTDARSSDADLAIVGWVRTPEGSWGRREVVVEGERIRAVETEFGRVPVRRRIDVGDAYVLPGMIDAHVHCLSHPGEGVTAATASAAAGGVTTIVEMPFDGTGPVNTDEVLFRKREIVEEQALVDVALLATVAPGGGWRKVPDLVKAGACGFKISLFDTDPRRFPRIDDAELLDVLAAMADANRVVCVHAENNEIVQALIARYAGEPAARGRLHGLSRPPVSETQGVLTALEAATYTAARLHLCHLSLPRSVDLVRWYAQDGLDVTLETCPHYLLLAEEDMDLRGTRLKINPPLRTGAARAGMWERLEADAVDIVSSDHAPWPLSYKTQEDVFANHSGAPGVETILPLTLSAALTRGESALDAAISAVTTNPAQRFGLADRKGQLAPGFDADIVVFDPAERWVIDERVLHSNAGWSPYHGRTNQGRVTLTVSRGRVVWDGENVLAEPGWGRFVGQKEVQ